MVPCHVTVVDNRWQMVVLAVITGSGKTLAFLLPIIAVLHQQSHQQQQQKLQQPQCAASDLSASGNAALSSTDQEVLTTQPACKRSKGQASCAKATKGSASTAAGTKTTAKGDADTSVQGNSEATKGPGAIILAPSRELAAQTARCLLLLLKGMKLRCTLLTAAVAAGTDFSKVCCCSTLRDFMSHPCC